MRLKKPERGGLFTGERALLPPRFLVMAALGLGLFTAGAWIRGTGLFADTKAWFLRTVDSAPNLLEGMLSQPRVLTFDIKHKDLLKLGAKRDEALNQGYLFASAEDFVPAAISLSEPDGTVVGPLDAKVRLKGDVVDPTERFKWPFRVGIRGDNTLLGMKRFSLHHPKARNWMGEWLYHQALRREDVLALRYQFVSLVLNGKDMGIFALEEHFEKRLLEHNQRREGPIVRFNENMFWREMVQQSLPFPTSQVNRAGAPSSSEVDTFQTRTVLADPERREQFLAAAQMLDEFRRGERTTSEIYDVEKLATYFAVTDLFGAEHGARWHNARFYFNPVIGRLEPIGFDGDSGQPTQAICALIEGIWIGHEAALPDDSYFARLFSDRAFFEQYMSELERVADPVYAASLLDALAAEVHDNLAILHKEFPAYRFDTDVLARNQRYIASVLDPVRALITHVRKLDERRIELEFAAVQGLPVEVLGVAHNGEQLAGFAEPVVVPGLVPGRTADRRSAVLELPAETQVTPELLAALEVSHRLLGVSSESRQRLEKVLSWPSEPGWQESDAGVPEGAPLEELPFVSVDHEAKQVQLARGQYTLDRDLVIPEGYALVATEGTSLDLVDSALVLVRGPVKMTAARDQPIVISSSDGTGQGLVVLRAGAQSTLSGVVFSQLVAPDRPGWSLTGAVTFYESPATLDKCRFERIEAEDALNFVRSTFWLDKNVFADISSDALDADFCADSRIVDTTFRNCGNDAVDVSGTVLAIEDLEVVRAGDKALSAGENSSVTARGVRVEDSEIGVASKDLSSVLLYEPRLIRCKVGFCAYQKKPEFGPGKIVAHGARWFDTEVPFLIEKGSSMRDGSKEVPANRTRVEDILYGVEYGEASK